MSEKSQIFKQDVRNLKAIQETRIKIGNGIYGTLIEEIIKDSKLAQTIKNMRRDKHSDRKQIAKHIKEALKEVGKTEEQLKREFELRKKNDYFYSELRKIEKEGQKILGKDLEHYPIYQWLKEIRGLGILTSAQVIAIIGDIRRFDTPSALWHYFGVHVVDGHAEKPQHGVELTSNPKAKALLLGVIGGNFLKQHSPYEVIYRSRTARTKQTHPEWWHLNPDGTKATGKNMHPKHGYKDGVRVMMKRFLAELFDAWYRSLGLEPPNEPYGCNLPNHHREPQIVPYKPT